jgi:hypothetical protein
MTYLLMSSHVPSDIVDFLKASQWQHVMPLAAITAPQDNN